MEVYIHLLSDVWPVQLCVDPAPFDPSYHQLSGRPLVLPPSGSPHRRDFEASTNPFRASRNKMYQLGSGWVELLLY